MSGSASDEVAELLKNFSELEIFVPENLDRLDVGQNLKTLQNAITEDLWIQIVYAREKMPRLTEESDTQMIKTLRLLKQDFDALMAGIYKTEVHRKHAAETFIKASAGNLKRIAQSFARADEQSSLETKHIKQARGLLVDNLQGLLDSKFVRSFDRLQSGRKYYSEEIERSSVIRTTLVQNQALTIFEIFEDIKGTKLFSGLEDLQQFLETLRKEGYIVCDIRNRYHWLFIDS